MIIWIVNPFDELPGENTRLGRYASIAEVLYNRGHEVHWWSSSYHHGKKSSRNVEIIDDTQVHIHLVPTKPYMDNISLARVRNHLQFAKIFRNMACKKVMAGKLKAADRILVSVPPLSVMSSALAIRNRFGGRVIFDIQDAWPQTFYRLVPGGGSVGHLAFSPIHGLAQYAYAKADAITGVAQGYVTLTKADLRCIPNQVTPIGISISQLDKTMQSKQLSNTLFTFTYLGSMSSNYDLTTVLLASKQLQLEGYKFKVLFAGNGPHEEYLKQKTKAMDLQDIIQFNGFLNFDGVVSLLANSDVALNCIFPSSYIFLPNKVGDYLGAGLPVINSIPGELAKLLEEYFAGIQYKAGNVTSLKEAMEYYLINRELVLEHGSNARKIAEILFDRDSSYPIWAEFIESL